MEKKCENRVDQLQADIMSYLNQLDIDDYNTSDGG